MHFNIKLIALLIGLSAINIATAYVDSRVGGQQNLLEFMTRTRDVSNEHPQRSMDCFGYYIPLLNDITAEYERSYGICLQKSSDAKIQVDNSTQKERNSIESSSKDSCQIMVDCSKLKSSIGYFQCFVDGGSQNSKTMYSISTNASDILAQIREKFRLIENDEFRCTNASERAYVEQTGNTYDNLHNCILGLSPAPTNQANSPPVVVTPANNFEAPTVFDRVAENSYPKDSQQFYIQEATKKFGRPYKLH